MYSPCLYRELCKFRKCISCSPLQLLLSTVHTVGAQWVSAKLNYKHLWVLSPNTMKIMFLYVLQQLPPFPMWCSFQNVLWVLHEIKLWPQHLHDAEDRQVQLGRLWPPLDARPVVSAGWDPTHSLLSKLWCKLQLLEGSRTPSGWTVTLRMQPVCCPNWTHCIQYQVNWKMQWEQGRIRELRFHLQCFLLLIRTTGCFWGRGWQD